MAEKAKWTQEGCRMLPSGLSVMQSRFCDEYLIDLNAEAAMERAGSTAKLRRRTAWRWLSDPNHPVTKRIKQKMDERAKRTDITADRVLQELAKIGFADIRSLTTWSEDQARFVPSDELDDDTAKTVQSVKSKTRTTYDADGTPVTTVELEIKQHDKLSALEKIGRHLGMFTDKVDLTTNGKDLQSGVVIVQLPDNGRDSTSNNPATTGAADAVPDDEG